MHRIWRAMLHLASPRAGRRASGRTLKNSIPNVRILCASLCCNGWPRYSRPMCANVCAYKFMQYIFRLPLRMLRDIASTRAVLSAVRFWGSACTGLALRKILCNNIFRCNPLPTFQSLFSRACGFKSPPPSKWQTCRKNLARFRMRPASNTRFANASPTQSGFGFQRDFQNLALEFEFKHGPKSPA